MERDFNGALISEKWREQNALLHKRSPQYGSHGHKIWKTVCALAEQRKCHTVLDYGCGKGALRQRLGKRVRNYDPAIPKWSAMPEPADMVVCRDVMEHVEEDCIHAVLEHIASLALRAAVFTIACHPAHQSLPDGRNTHCSIHPPEWWRERLTQYFAPVKEETQGTDYLFAGEPK